MRGRHIDIPFSAAALEAAQLEVVRANQLASGYIRPLAFLGAEKMGVNPDGAQVHVAIAAWPWNAYLGDDAFEQGILVKISSFARYHIKVQMCRSKSVSTYANSILANREARDEVYIADEAFFTGTAAEVTPIVEVDRRRIGGGVPGPITRALQEKFFACVRGTDTTERGWLSYVQ